MSRCECISGSTSRQGVRIGAACFLRVYLNATRAASSRVEEGEKQAGKKARFNGRNEFPAAWSAIASALFSAPFVNISALRRIYNLHGRRFTAETTPITSGYLFRVTSSRWTFQVHARLHWRHLYGKGKKKKRDRKSNQKKMQRNERLISFDCKMDIPRTVIEPCRGVRWEAAG